jgi:hypothetical protein
MAEVAIPRAPFVEILRLIDGLRSYGVLCLNPVFWRRDIRVLCRELAARRLKQAGTSARS